MRARLGASSCVWPCLPLDSAGEMRQAYLEKAESQKMKQKARERMQPKMGKLDIDYQVGCPLLWQSVVRQRWPLAWLL